MTGQVCQGCWTSSKYLSMKWYGEKYQAGVDRVIVSLEEKS